ncbi:hypothetical protein [Thiofilum flexile]|uniref:hypothetical protein n=1 Tax=Thiofilum flexile TaxID=125627 RepID=UPI000368CB4B|nr:hypothetical protein [Thiofilum flexile]
MISNKSGLASRLGWIMGELEAKINKSQVDFSHFTKENDEAALEQTLHNWEEILGVLDVLGAEGAFMLAREITLLLAALAQNKIARKPETYQITADGMVQIVEYLHHLQEGYADLPVIILPTLNNLRAAREVDLLSEHLVFLPEEGMITNEQIGTREYTELTGERLSDACKRLRAHMQKALLSWFRGQEVTDNLATIRKVSNKMLTLNRSERLRALWWVTSALTQALENNKLEHNGAVKMLLGRMEREIRRFGESGEALYNQIVPDELIKNLLYYVGLAEPGASLLDRVKDTYQLDMYLPRGESLEQLRHYYTMPGRELWRAVAGSMNEEIKQSIKLIESLEKEDTEQTPTVLKLISRSTSLAQAFSMLGLGRAAEYTELFAKSLSNKAKNKVVLKRDALMQMSAFYLRLERILKEYAETGYDITEQVFAQDATYDPETTRGALRAALAELGRANTELIAFSKEEDAFFRLHDVIKNLRDISGTLTMMDAQEVLPLSNAVAYYLQNDLRDKRRMPSTEEMATLADILTLLEAILSASGQNEDYLPLVPVGYEKVKLLDRFTDLDLAAYSHLAEAEVEWENKKKARRTIPANLYQRMRTSTSLSGLRA